MSGPLPASERPVSCTDGSLVINADGTASKASPEQQQIALATRPELRNAEVRIEALGPVPVHESSALTARSQPKPSSAEPIERFVGALRLRPPCNDRLQPVTIAWPPEWTWMW
jgi:hypothetical protein